MSKRFINGSDFTNMVFSGAGRLHAHVTDVNALNVFPVPDGDTGTNMNLTITSGVEALKGKSSEQLGRSAEVFSKGLLMGARGNSGVILSQLFRGFAKSVAGLDEIGPVQFAAALQQGVDTAYKAVVKPVEGTILTVSKDAAKHATIYARRVGDVTELLKETIQAAKESLARTPDLLPVLKQVGVVDAGGQGLVLIYEGFLAALTGEAAPVFAVAPKAESKKTAAPKQAPAAAGHEPKRAQAKMATEDIEHGYCTEFMVKLKPEATGSFDESGFRREMEQFGDSLLVVADDDLVKIHIHAEYPGTVMNHAMKFGELTRIKIENMREQHSHILMEEADEFYDADVTGQQQDGQETSYVSSYVKPYGIVSVAVGEGIAEIFTSLGVDYVLSGGQTMNPSTEDIVKAIKEVNAEKVFVFPNNSNIIMAAQQAVDLVEQQVVVIPTKTIPQGMAAALAFQSEADLDENTANMNEAVQKVISGQITYAVRDTKIDDVEIKEGDFLAIQNNKIITAEPDLFETGTKLLDSMLANGDVLMILTGEEEDETVTRSLVSYVQERYPDVELEVHPGGQPLYYYIFSVE